MNPITPLIVLKRGEDQELSVKNRWLRYVPLVFGLAFVIAILLIYRSPARHAQEVGLLRQEKKAAVVGERPRVTAVNDSKETVLNQTSQNTPLERPASLKVTLAGESQGISGLVVVCDGGGHKKEASTEVHGKGKAEAEFLALCPGTKQVIFIPHYSYAPISQEILLSSGQRNEVMLQLLRGVVVDMLQRPLEGAEIRVTMENLISSRIQRKKRIPIFAGGGAVGRRPYSYSLWSDGSLTLGTSTNSEGRFESRGTTSASVQAEVTYENVYITQMWPLDREAYIILPVYKEPPPPELDNPEYDELSRAIDAIIEKLGQNSQLDEIYWQQIRELMAQRLSKSRLSEKEKTQLQKIIDTVGRKPQEK
jgi:hypothetical protein